METVLAMIGGAAAKIYNDGTNNGILTDEYHKRILETLQCFLLAVISLNNFTFTVVTIVINYLNHLANENAFKAPHENSLLIVYPIFLYLSIASREYLNTRDILSFIYFAILFFFEPLVIKEERSVRKFVLRLSATIFFSYILYTTTGLSNGIYLTFAYGLGYAIMSTLYQGHYLLNKTVDECIDELVEGFHEIYTRFLTPDGEMYIFNGISATSI